MQAMRDLTITARVEAMLIASRLEISNLEVATLAARFTSAAIILAESIENLAADRIRKIPGVNARHHPFRDHGAGALPILWRRALGTGACTGEQKRRFRSLAISV